MVGKSNLDGPSNPKKSGQSMVATLTSEKTYGAEKRRALAELDRDLVLLT